MPCYVCKGAKLKCSMGSSKSELGVVHPVKAVNLHGKNMASITDHKPMINIKPFGKCKSLANPIVAAATAAASGKLQEMPCIPNTMAPWLPGKVNVLAKGKPALMDDCKCMCMWAGIIKITDSGQKTVKNGTAAGTFEPRQAESSDSQPSQKAETRSENKKPTIQAEKKILVNAGIDILIGNVRKKDKAENKTSQNTETAATATAQKTEQKTEQKIMYKKGDVGKVIFEINIRLSGFGGMLPTEEFTELTEKGVKQFQKDYMKISEPTGIVDNDTLKAIDEFSEKYREDVSDYKCKCGSCGGFGKGQCKNEYQSTNKIESYHKYEYPGMHQSLLWAVSASRFYLTKKLNNEYSIRSVSSAYRCWEDNKKNKRNTTNHMGKAVDLHFNKNNKRIYSDMDTLREKIYCECIGAPKQGGNSGYKFGWLSNKFGLEPNKWETGKDAANTWVHFDVREFDKNMYLKDEFFIKSNNDSNFNKKLTEITN